MYVCKTLERPRKWTKNTLRVSKDNHLIEKAIFERLLEIIDSKQSSCAYGRNTTCHGDSILLNFQRLTLLPVVERLKNDVAFESAALFTHLMSITMIKTIITLVLLHVVFASF